MLTPRLKTSKKWTAFPPEYTVQIETVFKENFAAQLKGSQLKVEGRIYPEEILLRVGFHRQGELRQANFEVSMEHSPTEQDALERIHNCVDAAASMMMDFFENEDSDDFPRSWKEFPFQNKKLYLQFTTENSDLEKEADRLLGLDEEQLVHEEDEADEPSGPQMFGGGKKKKDEIH